MFIGRYSSLDLGLKTLGTGTIVDIFQFLFLSGFRSACGHHPNDQISLHHKKHRDQAH